MTVQQQMVEELGEIRALLERIAKIIEEAGDEEE